MKINENELITFIKQQKQLAVDNNSQGNVFPTVLVEKDGKLCSIVVSPQIDKKFGLEAAYLCQIGFDPDKLIMIFDANPDFSSSSKEGQEFLENENYSDCMVYVAVDRNCEVNAGFVPYIRKNNTLKWQENFDNSFVEIGGSIPETLKKIISEELILDNNPTLKEICKNNSEKARFYTAIFSMEMMRNRGYLVIDYFSMLYPAYFEQKDEKLDSYKWN
jgi:hypothetical protein